jgi:hypothetical protein
VGFDLARFVAAVRALNGSSPVILVFASGPYAAILANWVRFASRTGANRILIVALADGVEGIAVANGLPFFKIPGHLTLKQLWVVRAQIFAALASAGIDFIHSDADAVWLKSPMNEIAALETDVAFSSGTVWPNSALEAWGFVVCCGFFFARGTPATSAFFSEVAARAEACGDDQIAVNEALLAAGATWDDDNTGTLRPSPKGPAFRTFEHPVFGLAKAGGLRICLLPHSRFTRLPEVTNETVVAHPLAPRAGGAGNGPARISQVLARLGLWQVEEKTSA